MNKAKIIAELENMVVARLFSGRPWLADRETISAYHRKLIQMGLVEQVCVEPQTWRHTFLGKELNVDLFQVFIGLWDEWEVPLILEEYGLPIRSSARLREPISCWHHSPRLPVFDGQYRPQRQRCYLP